MHVSKAMTGKRCFAVTVLGGHRELPVGERRDNASVEYYFPRAALRKTQ